MPRVWTATEGPDVEGASHVGHRVGQGAAQQAGQAAHLGQPAAGRWCRAGPGRGQVHGIEHGGGEGEGAQTVGEGVVELEQDGEAVALLARQDVRLPRGPAALQRAFHEPPGGRLVVGGGRVQVDVVQRVEVRVGLAHRAAEGQRPGERRPHVADAHAQSGDGGRPAGEQVGGVGGGGRRGRGEDTQRAEVHGVLGGLDVPERQVEGCERISSQGLASRRRRVSQ
ncbi:hypothetical protein RKD18_006874 [Streptomyces phaeoluteigriseus]